MLFKSGFAKFEPSFSEATLRHVSLNGLHDLHDISAFGYYGIQIVNVVERECSKPVENHQTLMTNRLQETQVLAQNTQNNEKIKIFWKTSLLILTNDLFVIKHLPCIILHLCTEKEVSARKRFSDIPLERRCNQEVTGWLTFDPLPQRAIHTILLPFTFQILITKLKHSTLSYLLLFYGSK